MGMIRKENNVDEDVEKKGTLCPVGAGPDLSPQAAAGTLDVSEVSVLSHGCMVFP